MRLIPNLIMLLFLAVLCAVQIALVLHFWESFAGDDPFYGLVFQALGVSFAAIEMVLLAVASAAIEEGRRIAAYVMRIAFIGLVAINLLGDIGAIYAYTTENAQTRAIAFREGETALTDVADLRARRDALQASLAAQELDLPVAALEVQLEAAVIARDAGGVGPRTQAWRTQRAASLEAALVTAREIAALDQRIADAQALANARPISNQHPQMDALAALSAWSGAPLDADTIRIGLALMVAIILRAMLAFGFWAAYPRGLALRGVLPVEKTQASSQEPSREPAFSPRLNRGPAATPAASPAPAPEPVGEGEGAPEPPPEPSADIIPLNRDQRAPKPRRERKPREERRPKDRERDKSLIETLNELDDELERED